MQELTMNMIAEPVTAPTQSGSARPRPVLMVPLRRCGSHALRLRLNFNQHFYSPYPLHIVDFMPLVPMYGDLSNDKAYFRLVVDVVGLQAASVVKWADMVFDPVEIFDAICDQPRSVHRIVWELLLRAGEKHGARIVMDKSLDSVHYAKELIELFPDMLFLNVVRDPRAQVASMNRAIIHDFDTTLNAREWVDAQHLGRSLARKYPDRVLTIRYEDFLSDQEKTLRKVSTFFGIDYLPEMLDVSRSSEAQQIAQLSALWESNTSAPIAANRDKFKTQLSMDEICTIETLAQDHMRYYGYEFMTAANAVFPDAASLSDARERSENCRRTAWRELEQNNYRDFVLRRFRADYLGKVRSHLAQQQAA
jgi:hypothetical protein